MWAKGYGFVLGCVPGFAAYERVEQAGKTGNEYDKRQTIPATPCPACREEFRITAPQPVDPPKPFVGKLQCDQACIASNHAYKTCE